jgi:tetratricopeptide (TPR) repeat protein
VKAAGWTAAFVLAASVLVSHAPLLRSGYVQDDHVAIEANALVAAGSVSAIVNAGYWDSAVGGDRSLYRPVTVASFALERAAFGVHPGLSHAINLILHAAVCWLLFSIAVRCGIDPTAALLAAVVFAVSPSKSEAVANVVGRSELLAALFTLGAVRCALETGVRTAAWAAAGCVILAGGSKETGIVALPLVVLVALFGRTALDVCGMMLPSALAFVVFIVFRTRALDAFFPAQTVPVIDNPLVREHGVRYAATAMALVARYASLVVWPFRLANDYSGASIPIEATFAAYRPLLGAALLAALAFVATRGRVAALFAAIVFLPYLLVSQFIVPAGAIFAERFLYLPVAGVCLLLALAIGALGVGARRVAIAVSVVFGIAMFARSGDWRTDATIFAATARNNPKSPKALYWLSRFDDAIATWPELAGPWQDKGLKLAKDGDLAGAERALRESVRLEPGRESGRLNLGIVLHRRGALDAAEREVRKAILLDPDNPRAFAELGHVRYDAGRFAAAAVAYRRAVALGRTDLIPRLKEIGVRSPIDSFGDTDRQPVRVPE